MAKKRAEESSDRHKGPVTPFRPDDPRLLDALDAYARTVKRSRNMTMVILLEEALRSHGFWPPPSS